MRKVTLFILIVFLYIFTTACSNDETIISSNPTDFIINDSQDVDEHSANLTDFIEYSSLIDLDANEAGNVLDFHVLDDVEYVAINITSRKIYNIFLYFSHISPNAIHKNVVVWGFSGIIGTK